MNISEFEISEESKSDYLRTVQEFRKMGVRCVSKTYEDVAELKRDAYKFRYIKGNVGGLYTWLIVQVRGHELLLINTEVDG